jgi:hypothetical protein
MTVSNGLHNGKFSNLYHSLHTVRLIKLRIIWAVYEARTGRWKINIIYFFINLKRGPRSRWAILIEGWDETYSFGMPTEASNAPIFPDPDGRRVWNTSVRIACVGIQPKVLPKACKTRYRQRRSGLDAFAHIGFHGHRICSSVMLNSDNNVRYQFSLFP